MAPVPISPLNVGHIDDVQELRNTKPRSIPERFVRDITERPKLSTSSTTTNTPISSSSSHMPIIDFSNLTKPNTEESRIEIQKLASACEDWGFFQVHDNDDDIYI